MRKIYKGIKKSVVLKGIDAHSGSSTTYRTYTAVLKCRDTDTKISTTTTNDSWKELEDKTYLKIVFSNTGTNGTDKLDEGFVDFYLYDSDKELIYTKMNFAKVFNAPIS